jgi:hypothetical protein
MKLCDKCGKNPAKYRVGGLTFLAFYNGVCVECCASFLRSNGDLEGAKKLEGASV